MLVNTKNANTFTGKQGKESLDIIAKNLSRILTLKESKTEKGTSETVKIKDLISILPPFKFYKHRLANGKFLLPPTISMEK